MLRGGGHSLRPPPHAPCGRVASWNLLRIPFSNGGVRILSALSQFSWYGRGSGYYEQNRILYKLAVFFSGPTRARGWAEEPRRRQDWMKAFTGLCSRFPPLVHKRGSRRTLPKTTLHSRKGGGSQRRVRQVKWQVKCVYLSLSLPAAPPGWAGPVVDRASLLPAGRLPSSS